jgi:hypothetical protein
LVTDVGLLEYILFITVLGIVDISYIYSILYYISDFSAVINVS